MRIQIAIIISALTLAACSSSKNNTTSRVVKPTYHHRWYVPKKDKRTKRVKLVRMK